MSPTFITITLLVVTSLVEGKPIAADSDDSISQEAFSRIPP